MKQMILVLSLVIVCVLQSPALASFPIPLPFEQLVDESTTIIQCKVIRMTPLVREDDKQVQEDSLGGYHGPTCFSLIKVMDVWKKHSFEDKQDASAADVYDHQGLLTIAHGGGRHGIGGLSHDLSEDRTYILFVKMIEPGLYRFTDGNSVYPIYEGKVPEMGVNMNDEDIAKSNPVIVDHFKDRVLKEVGRHKESGNRQE
ncbi:hypothetical protein GC197_07460 [bacterium]|nr:hypothetical protein [bacterium]